MLRIVGKLGILAALIVVIMLAIFWLALFYTEVGMAKEIGDQESCLAKYDQSDIPQAVIDDATELAREIVGNSQEKFQVLVDELLATYAGARDSDVVILFNSGGWGWNLLERTPGWSSILDGVKAKLDDSGYKPLLLNYQRTSRGLRGVIREFTEAVARYPSKAKELAKRVEFLTNHIPDIKVIVAGESTGTVISDKAMDILHDNEKVYSIQTGQPFWHKPTSLNRTLLMNSNGKTIDTFSYGKISTMFWATVRGWLGLSSPEENPGTILSWLRAPGHDYSWHYPGVSSAVIEFLEYNFGSKK